MQPPTHQAGKRGRPKLSGERKPISIRLPLKTYLALQTIAEHERWSLAKTACVLLEEAALRRGESQRRLELLREAAEHKKKGLPWPPNDDNDNEEERNDE